MVLHACRLHTKSGNDFTQTITIPMPIPNPELESIEVSSCYAVKNTTLTRYDITVSLKNSGSQDATVTEIMLNGKPLSQYTTTLINSTLSTNGQSIAIGQSGTIYIYISQSSYQSGTTLDLKFRTAAGKEYPQMLTLP